MFGATLRVRKGGGLQTSAVCQACHRGWIGALEAAVAPWIVEVEQRGDVARLQAGDRRLIFARWAVQLACLVDAARRPREICECTPAQLFQQPEAVPGHIHVLATLHPCPNTAIVRNRRNLWMEYPLGIRCEEPDCRSEGKFKVAFGVGRLLVVVAGLPSPHLRLVLGKGLHLPIWPGETALLQQGFYPLLFSGVGAEEALRHCSDLVGLAHAGKMM